MGKCNGIMKYVAVKVLELILFFLLVVYMPGLPPEGSFTPTKIVPSRNLERSLSLNTVLNNAEHIFSDKVRGPECLVDFNGELYTSVHGGEIVKLSSNGHVTHVAKFGQPCEGYWQEAKCGRPLGLAFDTSGTLYAMDAYYGIWKVNVKNGQKQLLVSPDVEIEGRKPKVFNSIALAANGDFYWTDSSSTTSLENGVFGMLLDGNGRLFHYDAVKNTSSVLLDGLWFANGVALSPNEEFVVVCETARSQLRRYYLKGPNKGTDDIFIDGLIGLPDNLKAISGGLLVPLVVPRDSSHPVVFQSLAPHPLIRKFLARIMGLAELPFIGAQKVLPHYVFERAIHWIGHFESVQALVPKRTSILKLNWEGEVVESWHCLDGSLSGISEVHIFKNQLFFGSPYNTYIGKVALPGEPIQSIRIDSKPQQAAPKPIVAPTEPLKPKPKPTEAPKPKPTEAPKPKPTEAPKPKPTEAPKPKPTEAPKPKPTEAPKPKPTEAPKPKPTEAPKPKPTEAPKPKPTEAPKPKPTEASKPKPTEAPKPKPTEAPKPKPNETVKPKPAEASKPKPKEARKPKPVEAPKKETKNPESETAPKPSQDKPVATPVVEEILSDTKPPRKDNMKVIKKEGPTEIPIPNNVDQGRRARTEPKTAQSKTEL